MKRTIAFGFLAGRQEGKGVRANWSERGFDKGSTSGEGARDAQLNRQRDIMEWILRNRRRLWLMEGIGIAAAIVLFMWGRNTGSIQMERWQLGLFVLPWAVMFLAAAPLIPVLVSSCIARRNNDAMEVALLVLRRHCRRNPDGHLWNLRVLEYDQ